MTSPHFMSWHSTSCAAKDDFAVQQLNLLRQAVHAAYLNAYLLPVNALSSVLLRLEAFAATSIQAAAGGRIVDALTEAHLLVTTTSSAGEGHALDQRLHCTDPHHSALDTHEFACSYGVSSAAACKCMSQPDASGSHGKHSKAAALKQKCCK